MSNVICNGDDFLENFGAYLEGSYEAFLEFGGPSVHFHNLCIEECRGNFLSDRHIELIYATLTSWGMHRMGSPQGKLTDWDTFRKSILAYREAWEKFRNYNVINLCMEEYRKALQELRKPYLGLKISRSNQTIVAHSKALFHILPDLIPPIDRAYTMKFLNSRRAEWTAFNGRNRKIASSTLQFLDTEDQFNMFLSICVYVKRLGDEVSWKFSLDNPGHIPPLKVVDNAIVNYVKQNAPLN